MKRVPARDFKKAAFLAWSCYITSASLMRIAEIQIAVAEIQIDVVEVQIGVAEIQVGVVEMLEGREAAYREKFRQMNRNDLDALKRFADA